MPRATIAGVLPFDGRPLRGISSVGRASGWQPEGQRFEPAILHSASGRPDPGRLCFFSVLPFLPVTWLWLASTTVQSVTIKLFDTLVDRYQHR